MENIKSNNYIENRPWGSFEILTQFNTVGEGLNDTCVKKLTVKPNSKLSYQSHKQRNEYWVIVQGEGEVIIDGVVNKVKVGSQITILKNQKHRAVNTSGTVELVIIESQTGHYDEEDIERFEDDYGRV